MRASVVNWVEVGLDLAEYWGRTRPHVGDDTRRSRPATCPSSTMRASFGYAGFSVCRAVAARQTGGSIRD